LLEESLERGEKVVRLLWSFFFEFFDAIERFLPHATLIMFCVGLSFVKKILRDFSLALFFHSTKKKKKKKKNRRQKKEKHTQQKRCARYYSHLKRDKEKEKKKKKRTLGGLSLLTYIKKACRCSGLE
jgi:hypothetical protein